MSDIRLETIRMHVRNKSCLLAGEAEYLLSLLDRANDHALQCDSAMHTMEEKHADLFYAGKDVLRAWDSDYYDKVSARVEVLRKAIKEIHERVATG